MRVYKIIATSWVLWIITLLTTLFSGAFLFIPLHNFLPDSEWVTILGTIVLIIVALYIQRFISKAVVKIELSDNTITIKWIKQFIFHSRQTRIISYSEIETYKYQEDRNFDLFKLTLKDGTDIRFWHSTFTRKDDFNKLVLDFQSSVGVFNKHINNKRKVSDNLYKEAKIEKAKTIFESEAAPLLAVFAIVLIIIIPILLFINPTKNIYNYFLGLSSMSGGIFFLAKYIQYRKKNKIG